MNGKPQWSKRKSSLGWYENCEFLRHKAREQNDQLKEDLCENVKSRVLQHLFHMELMDWSRVPRAQQFIKIALPLTSPKHSYYIFCACQIFSVIIVFRLCIRSMVFASEYAVICIRAFLPGAFVHAWIYFSPIVYELNQ
ncbi:unnamed protein product [Cylicocyclus nassatus]|uniref:Uncharacterized protein n=1 Tax=Cylicocyclus nassatus TaxID=53992 RepID=A0AA36GSL2_CYLNA|nr:unnamed protein product [Cylicocyclus nassatus]